MSQSSENNVGLIVPPCFTRVLLAYWDDNSALPVLHHCEVGVVFCDPLLGL